MVTKIKDFLEDKLYPLQHYFEVRRCKRLYEDYEDNEYNIGSLKHIWGVQSWDDLSGKNSNLYSMNDIEITYDRKTRLYMLSIETHYIHNDQSSVCEYLNDLLDAFTYFMDENGYEKKFEFPFFCGSPVITTAAKSIEELYTNFRLFVSGYCAIYKTVQN